MSFIRFKNPKPPSFNWNQNLNWEKDVRLINILGDSYTHKYRFKEFIVDSNPRCYVDIRPHATIADSVESISCTETTTTSEGVFVNFLSIGGATFERYLEKDKIQAIWARDVPEVTVLHVGACVIAKNNRYTKENIKKRFLEDLTHFLTKWPIEAFKQLKGHSIADRRARAQFERQLAKHKWLVVKIPQWKGSEGIRGINPEDFKQLKKRANTALGNSKTKLWETFRAAILAPHIEDPQFIPGQVHLTPEYQEKFNEQVLQTASKLLCEFCPWTKGKYISEEHKDLRENRNKCCRPIDLRRNLIGSPFQLGPTRK